MDNGDVPDGPRGQRNYSETELILNAKMESLDKEFTRPTFLFRMHKLPFKRMGVNGRSIGFKRQDLVVHVRRGGSFTFGQPEADNSLDSENDNVVRESESEDDEESETEEDDDDDDDDDDENGSEVGYISEIEYCFDNSFFERSFEASDFGESSDDWYYDRKTGDYDNGQIGLFGDCYSPFVSKKHCQIEREDETDKDKVWICDLGSERGTFVNGSKLTPYINQGLENGDIVSLGISHLDPNCKLSEGKFWVFKYVEETEEDESRRKDLGTQIFGNRVILSNICEHLNLKSLKKFRQVSNIWAESAKSSIKKKGSIGVNIIREEDETMNCWTAQFNRKVSVFNSLKLCKLQIGPYYQYKTLELSSDGVEAFENFFRSCSPQITEVSIVAKWVAGDPQHQNRVAILQSLFRECKNLQKVSLSRDISNIIQDTCNAKVLVLIANQQKFENIFSHFPQVKEIIITSANMDEMNFLEFCNEDIQNVKQLLPNLKILRIDCGWTGPEITENGKLLNKFPIKLEELELCQFESCLRKKGAATLLNSITGFSSSLVKLKVEIGNSDYRNSVYKLKFPKMQKLQVLEFNLNVPKEQFWKFSLAGFPKLEVIEINEIHGSFGRNCLKALLVKKNRKYFPSLQYATVYDGKNRSKNFVNWK